MVNAAYFYFMIRKYVTAFAVLLSMSICIDSYAQTSSRLEAEADPIAFIFNGYSFHLGYMIDHIRFDAGAYGIKQPSFFISNDKFSVYSSGIGVKADYFPRKNKGIFFGLQSDYATDKISLKSTASYTKQSNVTLGLRSGYRFNFGRPDPASNGFYLVPWIALIYASDASAVILEEKRYKPEKWSIFPTVHFGYRF